MKIFYLDSLSSVAEFLQDKLKLDKVAVDSILGALVRYNLSTADTLSFNKCDNLCNSVSILVRPIQHCFSVIYVVVV